MKEEFDFESIKNKAIEQLKAGKPLLGKDGAFAPLWKHPPKVEANFASTYSKRHSFTITNSLLF